MGTLAFYELLDESAYIAVFLVTSHNTVWRGEIFHMVIEVFMPSFHYQSVSVQNHCI